MRLQWSKINQSINRSIIHLSNNQSINRSIVVQPHHGWYLICTKKGAWLIERTKSLLNRITLPSAFEQSFQNRVVAFDFWSAWWNPWRVREYLEQASSCWDWFPVTFCLLPSCLLAEALWQMVRNSLRCRKNNIWGYFSPQKSIFAMSKA